MSFFSWIIQSINKEYERRIKAASQVTEYGIHHHDHDQGDDTHHQTTDGTMLATAHTASEEQDHDEGGVVISNVPRGSHLPSSEE